MRIAFIFLAFLGILSSCEDDDICLEGEKSPQLYLKFQNVYEADTARMDSIIIFRKNELGDFDLVKATAKANGIDSTKVSLRIDEVQETTLIISKRRYEPALYDTLKLSYTRGIEYGSAACGYKVIYEDITYHISHHFFVNQEVLDFNITHEETPHILLYY